MQSDQNDPENDGIDVIRVANVQWGTLFYLLARSIITITWTKIDGRCTSKK